MRITKKYRKIENKIRTQLSEQNITPNTLIYVRSTKLTGKAGNADIINQSQYKVSWRSLNRLFQYFNTTFDGFYAA